MQLPAVGSDYLTAGSTLSLKLQRSPHQLVKSTEKQACVMAYVGFLKLLNVCAVHFQKEALQLLHTEQWQRRMLAAKQWCILLQPFCLQPPSVGMHALHS